MHRVLAAVACALLAAACGGVDGPPPTSLPPTTAAPTPFEPVGTADVVRRWVAALEDDDLATAFGLLTPGSRERAGGEDGFRAARDERDEWARWATAGSAVFDALPVGGDLALVVLRGRFGEEDDARVLDAAAVPVRPAGDRWAVDAFGDVGDFEASPEPGSRVDPEPVLAILVDVGVEAEIYVDGQPAEGVGRSAAGEGRERIEVKPNRPLRPGEHVLAALLVDEDGEAAARAVVYVVRE